MTNIDNCPGCMSDIYFCVEHQKARIAYELLDRGDINRCDDPVYAQLLERYDETDEDME